jgi:hypothetical protein
MGMPDDLIPQQSPSMRTRPGRSQALYAAILTDNRQEIEEASCVLRRRYGLEPAAAAAKSHRKDCKIREGEICFAIASTDRTGYK